MVEYALILVHRGGLGAALQPHRPSGGCNRRLHRIGALDGCSIRRASNPDRMRAVAMYRSAGSDGRCCLAAVR